MISPLRPSPGRLEALLRAQRHEDLTYPEAGATRGSLPDGYVHGRHEAVLGRGDALFERAGDALRAWAVHRGAGVGVTPPDAPVATGSTVVLSTRLAGIHLTFACRVVYVVGEEHRSGFAYGTLPRHLLQGEEAFVVERDEAGVVRFTITAFLRPRAKLLRRLPFLAHVDQAFVRRRYLPALGRHLRNG